MTLNLLTEHPASVGETYAQHLRFATRFGASMILGGLACIIHGLLPFCLTTAGSRRVRALSHILAHHPARARINQPQPGLDAFNWSI